MRLATLRSGGAVELADLPQLGRPAFRTATLRVVLVAALAATLAALVLVARSAGTGRAAVFPEGTTTGIVALDMSASIAGPVYARVATTLKGIVDANQSIGLVMFSDTAYELLPPNSPPGALEQFIPFFVPIRYYGGNPIFAQSPWDQFSGGTRISRGLIEAEHALRTAHIRHGAILVVSDLDDSAADQAQLTTVALRLRRERIPVRFVPLFASLHDRQLMAGLFGQNSFVKPSVFVHRARRHVQSVAVGAPWGLIALGVLLVFLLAGNERWNGRLATEGGE
jgi:hypothetical protein